MERFGEFSLRHIETLSKHFHARHAPHSANCSGVSGCASGSDKGCRHDLLIGHGIDASPIVCQVVALSGE